MRWITHLEGGPKRVNHAAVAVDHKIYSFGGYCTGENLKKYTSMDVHYFNTNTLRWIRHPVSELPYFENDDVLPFKRYGHSSVAYKSKIFVWGGRNDRAACSVLFCFDTVYQCWYAPPTKGSIPLARDGHSACVWKHYMFIFGGYEEETGNFASTMYYLDLHTMVWKHVLPGGISPKVRDFHTTVCIGDRMYLFGGRGTVYVAPGIQEMDYYCTDLWYFDFHTFDWHQVVVKGDVPIGRRSHSAFVYQEKMYIFGGFNSRTDLHYNDLHEFDPKTNTWRQIFTIGKKPCKRRRQTTIVVDDRVYLFGGTSPQPTLLPHMSESDDTLIDHSDLFVLDFNPTLKTLALIAVKSYKLDDSILPRHLRIGQHVHTQQNHYKSTEQLYRMIAQLFASLASIWVFGHISRILYKTNQIFF